MTTKYNYQKGTEFDFSAPIRRAFDITVSSSDLSLSTRAIMVSAQCRITCIFVGDTETHTTFNLDPGILYPFALSRVTAITNSATIKGYA